MERLSLLDSEFLYAENELSPMHIGGVSVFEAPPPTWAEFREFVASKLDALPRYRQRVQELPLALGRPVWLDDPNFAIDRHLRRVTLPTLGRDAELRASLGRIFACSLSRDRPLWEAWLVDGIERGGWAIVMKAHHCMVDGIAGMDRLSNLFDAAPDAELRPTDSWVPESPPSRAELVRDALAGLASDGARWARRVVELAADPEAASSTVAATREGVRDFVRGLESTDSYSIAGAIGATRRFAHASADLEIVRTIREGLGGTINDVVLAAIAGAYRTLLEHRGDLRKGATLRTLVPVSVRRPGEDDARGNRVSATLCDLPVALADPEARLDAVREAMRVRKESHMVEAAEWATDLGDLAPPMIVFPLTRLVTLAQRHAPQRSVHSVTTNVPGPASPLFCLGRRMTALYPYVPITQGLRTGIAIVSYDGRLYFGVTADHDTVPDVDLFASAIELELEKLRDRAARRGESGDTSRHAA